LLKTKNWKEKHFEDGSIYLYDGIYEVGLDWDSNRTKPNLEDLKKGQIIIDEVPFVSLDRLRSRKTKRAKPKDLADVKLINDYLASI